MRSEVHAQIMVAFAALCLARAESLPPVACDIASEVGGFKSGGGRAKKMGTPTAVSFCLGRLQSSDAYAKRVLQTFAGKLQQRGARMVH